jgi:hypothetical protein
MTNQKKNILGMIIGINFLREKEALEKRAGLGTEAYRIGVQYPISLKAAYMNEIAFEDADSTLAAGCCAAHGRSRSLLW